VRFERKLRTGSEPPFTLKKDVAQSSILEMDAELSGKKRIPEALRAKWPGARI